MQAPLPSLRWTLPGEIQVAWSTAADGDQRDVHLREAFARPLLGSRRLIVPRQVHGVQIVQIARHDAPDLGNVDGVVTADPTTALGAYGADCPGVVLAAPDALGIAHCGWRGTAGGMVERLCTALAQVSRTPRATWHALIGPGISGSRYEVDEPVLQAHQWPASALRPSQASGRAYLDLPTVLEKNLRSAGISAIDHSAVCTATDPRLHSFRHRGPGLVQLLVVWR